MTYVRLSYDFSRDTPYPEGLWPIEIEHKFDMKQGAESNVFRFKMSNHVGTHIDGPNHFGREKPPLNSFSIDQFVFDRPEIVQITKQDGDIIDADDLSQHADQVSRDGGRPIAIRIWGAPVPDLVILIGFITGGVARGIVVGIAVTLVSLLFTEFSIESPVIVLLVAVLTSMLFSMAGMINAIFANSFDDISIIPTFVLTPLTYLGGIFYSISLLPELWQKVSLGNPILYMVNSFRYGFRGSSDIDLTTAMIVILAFNAVLFVICLTLLKRGTGIRQ